LEAKTTREILLSGFITNFLLTLIGFNWVAHTVHEFGHLPWAVSFIALILFCAFSNLNIPIAGYIWFRLFRHAPRPLQIISLVVLSAIAERLYPMIFDWHFGYTWLWIGWPAFQLADVIGFVGLSTMTIVFNGLILWSHLLWREKHNVYWRPFAAGVFVFGLMNALGAVRLASLPEPDKKAQVLIVQANIANNDKEYATHGNGTRMFVINKFFDLTNQALLAQAPARPTFAVWPETAFPDAFYDKGLTVGSSHLLHNFLVQKNLALATGGFGYVNQKLSNGLAVINEQGELTDPVYSKTHLLAFGEYIPGAEWFPFLKTWIPEIGDFVRGEGPTIFHLNGMRLGAQICYEGLFDSFSRGLANKGAQIIVNSTNDSWYPDWNEPFQHLYMTLARAVETRRPLVRATNTGISTVILANGEILTLSPRGQEWTHVYDVAYSEKPVEPPFLTWGFYLFPAILGLALLALLFWRWRNCPKPH
jgi:apolipoprotein N-acyltransferase